MSFESISDINISETGRNCAFSQCPYSKAPGPPNLINRGLGTRLRSCFETEMKATAGNGVFTYSYVKVNIR